MPQLSSPTLRVVWATLALALPAGLHAKDGAKPATAARATPIRDSIDRVLDETVSSHFEPCRNASRKGVPCFPVSVEHEGPRFSVAEALGSYRPTGKPAPSVPTVADTQSQLTGAPLSASGVVGFDPGCSTKNLWKQIRGRNTSYHLYRTWDAQGERPLLTDHLLDPEDFTGQLELFRARTLRPVSAHAAVDAEPHGARFFILDRGRVHHAGADRDRILHRAVPARAGHAEADRDPGALLHLVGHRDEPVGGWSSAWRCWRICFPNCRRGRLPQRAQPFPGGFVRSDGVQALLELRHESRRSLS